MRCSSQNKVLILRPYKINVLSNKQYIMMKKTLFALFALTCMTLGLTACGSDEPEKTVTATATYQIDFSEDLLEVANVAVVYIADNGQVSIENVPSGTTQWLRQVTCDFKGKSIDVGFKVVYTLKNNELTRNYELETEAKITAGTPTSHRVFEQTMLDEDAVRANKVAETITRNSNKAFGVNITREGSIERNNNFTVSI